MCLVTIAVTDDVQPFVCEETKHLVEYKNQMKLNRTHAPFLKTPGTHCMCQSFITAYKVGDQRTLNSQQVTASAQCVYTYHHAV